MGSVPKEGPRPKALGLKTKERIQKIKNGLVLQVAIKDGLFWDEVRKTRGHWDIEARVQLPPEDSNLLYPERLIPSKAKLTEGYILDSHRWETDIKRLWWWLVVPGLERYRLDLDWRPFMAALVLFQPPLDYLLEFAEYGEIVRKDPYGRYRKILQDNPEFRRKEIATSHDPMLVSPLIGAFPNPYSLERAQQDYYETLMEEINERFLKPRGLDIHEMKDEVLKDGTLDESLQERLRQIPQDLYVEVPKHAGIDELREAVGLAHSMQKEPEEEVSVVEASRTTLIKAELAHRYYCLNQSFLDLPKQRYPSIKSPQTYKQYAGIGHRLLDEAGEYLK